MHDCVSVDVAALQALAARFDEAAGELGAAAGSFAARSAPAAATFGDTAVGTGAQRAYANARAQTLEMSARLGGLFQRHADALRSAASVFARADADATQQASQRGDG